MIHCPYCMRPSDVRRIPFHCLTDGCGRDVEPVRRGPSSCPGCGQPLSRRSCPECHALLPLGYCDQPSRIIALFGAIESGKSVFVTVLVTELRRWLHRELGVSMGAGDDYTARRYAELWDTLYGNERRTPDKTPEAAGPAQVRPLVFTLSIPRTRWGRELHERVTLVFFDTAGEDMSDEVRLSKYGAYLRVASGIVFVVDPGEFTRADRDLITPGIPRSDPGKTMGEQTIKQLTNWRREFQNGEKAALAVPACLVVTKIDRLAASLSKDLVLQQVPQHRRGLNQADQEAVHDEVKGLLAYWGSQLGQLESQYRRFACFAVSALGNSTVLETDHRIGRPRPHVHPGGVRPHRVIDPLLWLLAELDLVPRN